MEGAGVRRKKRESFFVLFWKNKREKTRFFVVGQDTGGDELDFIVFFLHGFHSQI